MKSALLLTNRPWRALAVSLLLFGSLTGSAEAASLFQITLQPVLVSGTTGTNFSNDLNFANAIFNQANVAVTTLSTIVDYSVPNDMSNPTLYTSSPSEAAAPVITVWFVNTIFGNAAYRGDSTGSTVWVADSRAADTLAHEIGHILTGFNAIWQPDPNDTAHSLDAYNLLAAGTNRLVAPDLASVGTFDQLQPSQVAVIQNSAYVGASAADAIPEPSTAWFAASGLLMLWISRGVIRRSGESIRRTRQ